jgi:hypothetical protein
MNKLSMRECIDHLNGIIEECEVSSFITRDRRLQEDSCSKLSSLLNLAASLKSQAIEQGNEDAANTFLGFECVGRALHSEITMWMLLKDGKPDEAWTELISAQMNAVGAARAHNAFANLTARAEHLETIESTVFPPQVFVSAGLIVRRQECSICGSEYGDCTHVAGRPYWGRFCAIIARDLEANHTAIVKTPADKRCRVTHFENEDGNINRMTWKAEPSEFTEDKRCIPIEMQNADGSPPSVLYATAIILSTTADV